MKPIILEGPNGAGKSTLADYLSNELDMSVLHATKPASVPSAIHLTNAQLENILMNRPAIYDRSHAISRLVYQDSVLSDEERMLYEAHTHLLLKYCNVVYCTGEGLRDTNKPHYTEELIKETTEKQEVIKDLYKGLFFELDVIKFDFSETSALQVLKSMI